LKKEKKNGRSKQRERTPSNFGNCMQEKKRKKESISVYASRSTPNSIEII
jgi:hypothetical protein